MALAASAWSIALLIPGGRLMSEASFFCATMVALWAASAPDPSRRRVALAMAAAFAAAYFRTVGLALLAALVVLWAFERHWRRAALLAAWTATSRRFLFPFQLLFWVVLLAGIGGADV